MKVCWLPSISRIAVHIDKVWFSFYFFPASLEMKEVFLWDLCNAIGGNNTGDILEVV